MNTTDLKVGDSVVNTQAPEVWGHGTVVELQPDGARVEWSNGRVADHFFDQLARRKYHLSGCAMCNEPAYPNGPCDCGAFEEPA